MAKLWYQHFVFFIYHKELTDQEILKAAQLHFYLQVVSYICVYILEEIIKICLLQFNFSL